MRGGVGKKCNIYYKKDGPARKERERGTHIWHGLSFPQERGVYAASSGNEIKILLEMERKRPSCTEKSPLGGAAVRPLKVRTFPGKRLAVNIGEV